MAIFRSFLQAGFECSTHFDPNGSRLDMLAETQHDKFVEEDYRRISEVGILTARDGVRWHLIEKERGVYDFSSVEPFIHAAQKHNIQIIWDVLHYGLPDWLSYGSDDFTERFVKFAVAFTEFLKKHGDEPPFLTLINEISFLAFSMSTGDWYEASQIDASNFDAHRIKRRLVQSVIAAIDAVREVKPEARFVQTEPLIHIIPKDESHTEEVWHHRNSQFEVWDMLRGTLEPELGGDAKYLDIIGLNHFPYSQWVQEGDSIHFHREEFMPLSTLLTEIKTRYEVPFFISETSVEGEDRAAWFEYVTSHVRESLDKGIPVEGICLYPILDYPAWDRTRFCDCGLWGFPSEEGDREAHEPLLEAIQNCNIEI